MSCVDVVLQALFVFVLDLQLLMVKLHGVKKLLFLSWLCDSLTVNISRFPVSCTIVWSALVYTPVLRVVLEL